MSLHHLHLDGFRNLATQQIGLSNSLNLVVGQNGTGKTSFLESIFMLLRGRSFRSSIASHAVNYHADALNIFGRFSTELEHNVGLTIGRKLREHKLSGVKLASSLLVTQLLPVIAVHSSTFSMLDAPSKIRRQILDWGAFHVEPSYLDLWRRYCRILSHRNALLRSGALQSDLGVWDLNLADYGERLNAIRCELIDKFLLVFEENCNHMLQGLVVKVYYNRGWAADKKLYESIKLGYQSDSKMHYTQSGPHRADFSFSVQGRNAKNMLSRGQIRLVVLAFITSFVSVIKQLSGKHCLMLVDDLGSELDSLNFYLASNLLLGMGMQICMTELDIPDWFPNLSANDSSLFHVEQGYLFKA